MTQPIYLKQYLNKIIFGDLFFWTTTWKGIVCILLTGRHSDNVSKTKKTIYDADQLSDTLTLAGNGWGGERLILTEADRLWRYQVL